MSVNIIESIENQQLNKHEDQHEALTTTGKFLVSRGYAFPSQVLIYERIVWLFPHSALGYDLRLMVSKITDLAKQTIDSMFIQEQRNSKDFVFYHAFPGVYNNEDNESLIGPGLAYDLYPILAEVLLDTQFNIPVLPRFFHDKKMQKIKNNLNDENPAIALLQKAKNKFRPDFDSKVVNWIISTNFHLFGSMMYERSDCSLEFFAYNKSFSTFSLVSFFKKAGFGENYLERMQVLYKKCFEKSGGQMLQIFVDPGVVDEIGAVTYGGGEFFINRKVSEVIKNYIIQKRNPTYGCTDRAETHRKYEEVEGMAQVRLFCDPEIFSNSDRVKIFEYSYGQEPDRQAYRHELRGIITEMVQHWFNDSTIAEKRDRWLEKRFGRLLTPKCV